MGMHPVILWDFMGNVQKFCKFPVKLLDACLHKAGGGGLTPRGFSAVCTIILHFVENVKTKSPVSSNYAVHAFHPYIYDTKTLFIYYITAEMSAPPHGPTRRTCSAVLNQFMDAMTSLRRSSAWYISVCHRDVTFSAIDLQAQKNAYINY